jgi:hypothetical protein
MKISKYNKEGYPVLTEYYALKNIEAEERRKHFRPLVYICSPYAGDTKKNVRQARKYSRFAVSKGYIPLAPHLLFPQFLNDGNSQERKLGLFFGNVLMSKCAEIWVFGDSITNGMRSEIKYAQRKKYTLRYFTETLEEFNHVHDLHS